MDNSTTAEACADTIGLLRPIVLPTHMTSTSTLMISIHNILMAEATVSQFAMLQNKSLSSSTSPSVIVENAPLNFVRGGYYIWDGGQLNERCIRGLYWPSTATNSTEARSFGFGSSIFYPKSHDVKGGGFSVHCVA